MITDEFIPKNRQDWRSWLEKNCTTTRGIWLVYYKKSSKKFNLSYGEARDEALCFGWIDSTLRRRDSESHKQYFSPRRKGSIWSKFNRDRVEKLLEANLMTKYGLEAIERAKTEGNYYLLDSLENMSLPFSLEKSFRNNKKLRIAFDSLNKNEKRHLLHRLLILKTEAARERHCGRIIEILEGKIGK